MPLYRFFCPSCSARQTRILRVPFDELSPEKVRDILTCKMCGKCVKRDPSPPTTQSKETLDNGAMPHAVERLKDAEELYKDRAENDPSRKS